MEDPVALFQTIGLSENKAKETAKNAKVAANLVAVIGSARKHVKTISPALGTLLYHVASKMKPQVFHHSDFVVGYLCDSRIDSEVRLNAALDYLLRNAGVSSVDAKAFEAACGVGVVVTPEQIEKTIEKIIAEAGDELVAKRYRYPIGTLMAKVRESLPWADGKAVKSEVDLQVRSTGKLD
jgi:glutaminyl-tRNA synthetase